MGNGFWGMAWGAFLIGVLTQSGPAVAESRLINGTPVDPGTYTEVVQIKSDGASCTATVVGPRVIITAGHCADPANPAVFSIGTKQYQATMTRSPIYPGQDHDLAVGLTNEDIAGVTPAVLGGTAKTGLEISLLGYGCTHPGGGGGNDGILRIGKTDVTEFSGTFEMVSRKADGAALCFGDSGGPAYVQDGAARKLIGVSTKGNVRDTNYDVRMDIPATTDWLKSYAGTSIIICGINSDCGVVPPPPPPPAPTCTLTANPPSIQLGQSLALTLTMSGTVSSASIEGTAVDTHSTSAQKVISPPAAGTFTASATVTGPGGTSNCSTSYTVQNTPPPPPPAPTCVLTATPNQIKINETLTLEMTSTHGLTTTATIDGQPVSVDDGKKYFTGTIKGTFTSYGQVAGPGGTGSCSVSYSVVDNPIPPPPPPPPPDTPTFAVVPAYCGPDTLGSRVSTVCISVLKRDSSMLRNLQVTAALLITYRDTTKEVMPVVFRKAMPKQPGDQQNYEELTLYANNAVQATGYMVLDTRWANVTYGPNNVPLKVSGRTAMGVAFDVESLTTSVP